MTARTTRITLGARLGAAALALGIGATVAFTAAGSADAAPPCNPPRPICLPNPPFATPFPLASNLPRATPTPTPRPIPPLQIPPFTPRPLPTLPPGFPRTPTQPTPTPTPRPRIVIQVSSGGPLFVPSDPGVPPAADPPADPAAPAEPAADPAPAASGTAASQSAPESAPAGLELSLDGTDALAGGAEASYTLMLTNLGGPDVSNIAVRLMAQDLPLTIRTVDIEGERRGFSCRINRPREERAFVSCTGGSLVAGEAVTITVGAEMADIAGSGSGAVLVEIDPGDPVADPSVITQQVSLPVNYN